MHVSTVSSLHGVTYHMHGQASSEYSITRLSYFNWTILYSVVIRAPWHNPRHLYR
jgi:hypothetical protein